MRGLGNGTKILRVFLREMGVCVLDACDESTGSDVYKCRSRCIVRRSVYEVYIRGV